jgi:ligand-binding sensor domain-containing protein
VGAGEYDVQGGMASKLSMVLLGVFLCIGGFWLGTRYGSATPEDSALAMPRPAGTVDEGAPGMPPAKASADASPDARSAAAQGGAGKARASGPQQIRYTHFRVGNRNVKALLADDGVMWVGTSGGVVRYDLETDEHRLFDVRSGLLSNGIFHLSKLGERLVVGTYTTFSTGWETRSCTTSFSCGTATSG